MKKQKKSGDRLLFSSLDARVRLAIEEALEEGLPRAYSKEVYETKYAAVFDHVYESYQGEGKSVYSTSGV